jgi:hypothetical protein
MIDMQTSFPLLIVRPSILNPVINFSTHLWPMKWNTLQIYLCLMHYIPSPVMLMQHMHNHITNDMIHFISSRDHIGSSILTSLAFHHCLHPSAPSLTQSSPPRGPSLQSLQLALHACNRSIKPSLVLIFSTLVTWLNVMYHMQWAPSSHVWALQQIQTISPLWHELLTQVYLWTNHLCISYLNTLVHLDCHTITKTKLGTFQLS